MAYCFRVVMEGKFTWDNPRAPFLAVGAILAVLGIALAGYSVKQNNPREYGLTQVLIGCVVLITQFGEPPSSGGFAIRFLAALFFLVQGIENINRKPNARP
jgi:uncharacterized membrane protein HdeD (DUF308 family)